MQGCNFWNFPLYDQQTRSDEIGEEKRGKAFGSFFSFLLAVLV
jgi:hypothetical protein